MPVKPSQSEEEYFAREEALKKQKLALEQTKKMLERERRELKDLHFMHCPKCGMDLHAIVFRGVEIDRCFHCHGTWLDAGELEKLAIHEKKQRGAVVRSVLNIFEPEKGQKRK